MGGQRTASPKRDSAAERLKYLLTKSNAPSSSTSYSALVEIRMKFITKPKYLNLFIQLGGLKVLIEQLSKTNRKIIDVSVSILGHCVREDASSRDLFQSYGGLPPLVRILESLDDRNIQIRTCTALGTLAKDKKACSILMDVSAHLPVSRFVESSEDEELLRVSLRSLTIMADRRTHVATMGWDQVPRKIWLLLERTESESVIKFTLQTLNQLSVKFAQYENYKHYWIDPLLGGRYVKKLVSLLDHSRASIVNSVLTLLQQLVKEQHTRKLIANRESFAALIPVISEEPEKRQGWKTLVTSTFLMCREHPVGFFQAGGIPVLMDLIQKSCKISPESSAEITQKFQNKLESCHELLFNSLLTFEHDPESLLALVDLGVIEILLSKISDYTEDQPIAISEPGNATGSQAEVEDEPEAIQEPKVAPEPEMMESSTRRALIRGFREYRINSPSYQAVGEEFDQLLRLRGTGETEALNIFGWNPNTQHSVSCSPQSSLSRQGSDSDLSEFAESLPSPSMSISSPSRSTVSSPAPSDASSCAELGELTFAPLVPDSSSDLSDEELGLDEDTICYSPVDTSHGIFARTPSPVPPPSKQARKMRVVSCGKFCCDENVQCSSFHLGEIEKVNYYGKWPVIREQRHLRRSYADWSLHLIQTLCWLPQTPAQLADEKTLEILLKYLTQTRNPSFRACRILFRLSSHSKLFSRLLQSQLPTAIYVNLVLRNAKECCPLHHSIYELGQKLIERLRSTVDTFGRGELENALLKESTSPAALSAVLASPIIVSSKRFFYRILVELKGLDLLLHHLLSTKAAENAVASLTALTEAVGFKHVEIDTGEIYSEYSGSCAAPVVAGDFSIHLSSGETLSVNKDLLKSNAYFNAMFSGSFQESVTGSLHLKNVSLRAFRILIHAIYGCGTKCPHFSEIFTANHETELELLQWSDRLLLFPFHENLTKALTGRAWHFSPNFPENFLISLKNVLTHEFSSSNQLRQNLLLFIFRGPLSLEEKTKLFQQIVKSDFYESVIGCLRVMLSDQLNIFKK